MPTIRELLEELDQEAAATRRVLERVPEEHLGWRPHPKSMSLGELALHVARIPGAIAEVSTGPFDVHTVVPRPAPADTAELLAAHDESLARARTLLGAMTDAELAAPWRMTDGDRVVMEMPRSALFRSVMLNHWYHHRGQLTVYLRENEVPLPAIYGDSADESAFGPPAGNRSATE